MTGHANELALRIRMSQHQVAHLPMFVEVTLANPATHGEEYIGLTACNPWAPPFPVAFTFSAGSREMTLPGQSPVGLELAADTFDLPPGNVRTWVLDLSELDVLVPPGAWHCSARWLMRDESPRSSAASVTIEPPKAADVPLLGRLRVFGDADTPSWANLVEERHALASPEVRGLSAESRRALAPYFIIHRAVHGSHPLSKFPPEQLLELEQGPWASEAAVLRYELAWARHAVDRAHLRASILASWPGVKYRLDEVDQGAGLLTALRDRVGPGSEP